MMKRRGFLYKCGRRERRSKPPIVEGLFSVSPSYAIWITGQVTLRFLLFVLLLECIFLSEHFLDIVREFADEIRTLSDFLFLVVLSAPEAQFALPVASCSLSDRA
jgi:hypothetical protein